MKKICFAVSAGVMLITAQAFAVYVDHVSGYYSQDGGEFNVSPVNSTGYAADVLVNNGLGNLGYETFCMQVGETVVIPGTYSAYSSQTTDTGKALTVGVAYLYSQFVGGALGGYDYTAGVGREASAWALQNAIWYLQGENNIYHTTAAEALAGATYISLVGGLFVDPTEAATTYGNTYGVDILNLYNGTAPYQLNYQSMLTLQGVPDGGVTAILLGLALGAIGLVSRRWRLS